MLIVLVIHERQGDDAHTHTHTRLGDDAYIISTPMTSGVSDREVKIFSIHGIKEQLIYKHTVYTAGDRRWEK